MRSNDSTDLGKRARGRWGEERAARHYERAGYRVLDRNWRSSTGELDLVAERDGIIVFCEVKARRNDRFGPAAAAVGPEKRRRIRRLALEWIDANDPSRRGIRFDVVAITGVDVRVFEAAF
jgi:putative endonuclease